MVGLLETIAGCLLVNISDRLRFYVICYAGNIVNISACESIVAWGYGLTVSPRKQRLVKVFLSFLQVNITLETEMPSS